jgi:hypothetical protein
MAPSCSDFTIVQIDGIMGACPPHPPEEDHLWRNAQRPHRIKFNLMGVSGLQTYISFTPISDQPSHRSRVRGSLVMKKLSVVCGALCIGLSTTTAFARGGGMGSMGSHMSVTGGALGTSAATPGTNSLGTALPSSGVAEGAMKGPLLGTSPGIDREEAKVEKMIGSICRGC